MRRGVAVHDVEDGRVGGEVVTLVEHPEGGAAHPGDASAVGRHGGRQDAQEGRLACPVGADDADPVAVVEAERDAGQEGAGADGQRYAVRAEEMCHQSRVVAR
nr:hypothetical protein GCM10025730_39110 [Promicromonospora thailandica]